MKRISQGSLDPQVLTNAIWRAAYKDYRKKCNNPGGKIAEKLNSWLEDWLEVEKQLKASLSQR
jgi:hypothetical protein